MQYRLTSVVWSLAKVRKMSSLVNENTCWCPQHKAELFFCVFNTETFQFPHVTSLLSVRCDIVSLIWLYLNKKLEWFPISTYPSELISFSISITECRLVVYHCVKLMRRGGQVTTLLFSLQGSCIQHKWHSLASLRA